MKVLQLIQRQQLRGAEIFACQLAERLQSNGVTVHMVYLFSGSQTLEQRFPHLKFIPLNANPAKRFWDVNAYRRLASLIKAERYDAIQANAGDTLKYSAISRFLFRWKMPLIFRNANKVSDFINTRTKLIVNRFFINQLDHVISVSELCRLDFIGTYKFPEKKTTLIPIGIDPVHVTALIPEDLKVHYINSRVLVNIGSLVPEKNHAGLIEMAPELIRLYPDIRILILGDGKLRAGLQKKIMDAGLEKQVFLLGYRTDVLPVLSQASLMVMPSLIEGLPGVILEAFYCKVPVVAYNAGGIGEIVKTGTTGWLIPKNDKGKFIQAIAEIFDHPSEIGKITNAAFDLVQNNFLNEQIAARFKMTYEQLSGHKNTKE